MYQILICVLILSINVCTYAQPDSLWSRTYGGITDDGAYSLEQTSDGGYVLAGYSLSFTAGSTDFWMVKTDANGNQEWNKRFGGIGQEACVAVQQTNDGGYALAGYTFSFGAGGRDFWLVKTNANGDSLWSRTYGGILNDYPSSMQQTSDGGYIMAGTTNSFGNGYEDFWLVKTDAYGTMEWHRTFGEAGVDEAAAVQQTSDGGYALAGTADTSAQGYNHAMLVKTDANGIQEWRRTFGHETDPDECYDMLQTSDGGYAIVGHNNYDRTLVKLDADGNEQWTQIYESFSAFALSFVQTGNGGYALAGYNYVGVEHADFWLGKTDANGNHEWAMQLGGTGDDGAGNDFCWAVCQTNDEGYALAGLSRSFGAGGYDMWLVKTGPDLSAPSAPEHLTIMAMGSDIHLRWDSLNDPEVTYNIYSDITAGGQFQNLVGTTADNEFVDVGAIEQPGTQKFYVVKAERP